MRRLLLLVALGVVGVLPPVAEADSGLIEGTVAPAQWAQEVEVCLVEAKPSVTCTVPEAGGHYVLGGLPLGVAYLEFIPSYRSRLATQYYKNSSLLEGATPIILAAKEQAARNINANLVEAGTIEGSATAAVGGEPLSEVEVCAISVAQSSVRSCVETGADGGYELHSLQAGKYKVGFWGRGGNGGLAPQYYQGRATFAEAAVVSVVDGTTVAGIDAELAEGARIEGVVSGAPGGQQLDGVEVCLFTEAGPYPERCTYSDEGGRYAFAGLPSGSYQVGFSLEPSEVGGEGAEGEDDGLQTQFFDDASGRAAAQTLTLLAPAIASGIDALLSPVPAVSPITLEPTAADPIVSTPPPVAAPPRSIRCKKGYRRKKVKGKVRCVKTLRHKKRRRRQHRS